MIFAYRGIQIEFNAKDPADRFYTTGISGRFGPARVHVWRDYVSGVEKAAMRSSNCTDELRKQIAIRAVDAAIEDKCSRSLSK
jgi:ribosomal protein L37AE/L43A